MVVPTDRRADIRIGLFERKRSMDQDVDLDVCIVDVGLLTFDSGRTVSLEEWRDLDERRWLASSSVLYFIYIKIMKYPCLWSWISGTSPPP